jgi:predicted dehydrogenase
MLRIAPPGARLMVHENWRFRPWYRIVKAWLASGRIGTLRQVRMAYLGSGLLADERGTYPVLTRQPYMGRISRLMVAEVLTHHLDVLRWLFGPLRVEAAAIARGCNAVRGESCASAMMIDRNGAAIVLEGNMTARGYPARPSDRLEILGDDGRVLLEGPSLTLDAANGERHDLDLAAGYQASFDAALAHFVDGLHSGREFETSPTDNLETLRLVEAVYAKAEQGKARSREAAGLGEVTQ